MTRHRLDWLSAVFGLLGVAVAAAVWFDVSLLDVFVSAGPTALVVGGVALLVAATGSAQPTTDGDRDADRDADEAAAAVGDEVRDETPTTP